MVTRHRGPSVRVAPWVWVAWMDMPAGSVVGFPTVRVTTTLNGSDYGLEVPTLGAPASPCAPPIGVQANTVYAIDSVGYLAIRGLDPLAFERARGEVGASLAVSLWQVIARTIGAPPWTVPNRPDTR